MAIPTVGETIELPGGGVPPSSSKDRIRVRARLVAGERGDEVGYAESAGVTVAHELWADLDENGRWELDLRYNSGSDDDRITAPTGTRWEVTPVYLLNGRRTEGQRRYCAIDSDEDGEGPFEFSAVEVGDENTVPPTAASVIAGQISDLDDAKVARSGDTMSGDLDLDGNRVTGLPEPTEDHEPARKAETDALDAAKVAKSGLDADLPAAGHRVTGLGAPTDAADAARKADVDAEAQAREDEDEHLDLAKPARVSDPGHLDPLRRWLAARAAGNPVVVWLTDSNGISWEAEHGDPGGFRSAPWLVHQRLCETVPGLPAGWDAHEPMDSIDVLPTGWTGDGTEVDDGLGGLNISLDAGESRTITVTGAALDIVYRGGAAGLSITSDDGTWNDTFGGEDDGDLHRWESPVGLIAARDVTLTATGTGSIVVHDSFVWQTDRSGPRYVAGSHFGWSFADFDTDATSERLAFEAPDLVVVLLGAGSRGDSTATWLAELESLLDRIAAACDATVAYVMEQHIADHARQSWEAKRDAARALCTERGVVWVDGLETLGTMGAGNPFGFDDELPIPIHLNAQGQQALAGLIADPLTERRAVTVAATSVTATNPVTGQPASLDEVVDRRLNRGGAIVLDNTYVVDVDVDEAVIAAVATEVRLPGLSVDEWLERGVIEIPIVRFGTGEVTVVGVGGATIRVPSGFSASARARYSVIVARAAGHSFSGTGVEWLLAGDLTSS